MERGCSGRRCGGNGRGIVGRGGGSGGGGGGARVEVGVGGRTTSYSVAERRVVGGFTCAGVSGRIGGGFLSGVESRFPRCVVRGVSSGIRGGGRGQRRRRRLRCRC